MENVSCSRPSVILLIEQGSIILRGFLGFLVWNEMLRFEPRWLKSLSGLEIPIQLLWGDSDAVSPLAIPNTVASHVKSHQLTYKMMAGAGEKMFVQTGESLKFIKVTS